LLIGGSFGKNGAVVLATTACLRSGAGLVTTYVPHCGYNLLQTTAPEAMVIADNNESFLTQPPPHLERFTALGIGPGAGTEEETGKMLQFIIKACKKPMVLDADALNLLAQQRNFFKTPYSPPTLKNSNACSVPAKTILNA
jgi:NAD(P)H-hydrate epimerase